MHPSLRIEARSGLEFALLCALLVVFAACAHAQSQSRPAGFLLVSYVSGLLALALLAHAWVGHDALVVSTYAVTVAIASIAACCVLLVRLRDLGLPESFLFGLLTGGFVLAIAAGRVVDALATVASSGLGQVSWARLFDRRQGGLSVFGAIVAVALYVGLRLRRHPTVTAGRVLDASASTLAVVVAAGRAGCLLAGCCYGATTTPGFLTLSVITFAPDSPAGAAYAATPGASVWATQPVEAVLLLGIAALSEWLYRTREVRSLREGAIFATCVGLYGACRSGLEIVRADSDRIIGGRVTVWQVLGLAMAGAALAWHAHARATSWPRVVE